MEHLLFVVLVGLANGAAIRSFSLDERLQAACDSDGQYCREIRVLRATPTGVAVIELEPGHHYLSKTLVLPKACNVGRIVATSSASHCAGAETHQQRTTCTRHT